MANSDDVISWADLPLEPIVRVFSFLNPKEICLASQVSTYWREMASSNEVWKKLFLKQWVSVEQAELDQIEDQSTSFKQLYGAYQKNWGKYEICYPQVRGVWNRIEVWLKQNAPKVFVTLNRGATEAELDEFEAANQCKLPLEVRCSYRIRNGQTAHRTNLPNGIFGGYEFYDHHANLALCSLAHMKMFHRGNVPTIPWMNWCIPVLQSFGGFKVFLVVDEYTPEKGSFRKGVIAEPAGDYRTAFQMANNFLEMLENLADSYEGGNFEVSPRSEIIRFDSKSPYVETTKGVCIQASPLFIPESSNPLIPQYMFAYRIRMTMASHMSELDTCKLETRHWLVYRSEHATPEEVRGPGVIGLFPVASPGSSFEYASCSPINSTQGSMTGSFQMRNLASNQLFDASVPRFQFKVPPVLRDAATSARSQPVLMLQ